jgi:hypothetical protein
MIYPEQSWRHSDRTSLRLHQRLLSGTKQIAIIEPGLPIGQYRCATGSPQLELKDARSISGVGPKTCGTFRGLDLQEGY